MIQLSSYKTNTGIWLTVASQIGVSNLQLLNEITKLDET